MSLFDTFDPDSEELIRPSGQRSFHESKLFPEVLIAAFKDETFEILKNYPVEQIAALREGRTVPVYQTNWRGRPIGIYQSLAGGPAAVCLLEQALAMGAKKVLYYGNCGVLDKEIATGRLIVPSEAYRDEGTSYHYLPAGDDYIKISTSERLSEILRDLRVPFTTGKVWTTDAFYRETRSNARKRRQDGCIAVDMECASVMAAAKFRNAEVYQFFYADDCLDGESWDARTLGARPASEHEKFLRLALETAARL